MGFLWMSGPMFLRCSRVLIWFCLLAGFLVPVSAVSETNTTETITELSEVRKMSNVGASVAQPVRVVGIVTWVNAQRVPSGFIMQDESAGIFVRVTNNPVAEKMAKVKQIHKNLKAGDKIEIEGVTGTGNYAPVVHAHMIRSLGRGVVPPALDLGLGNLLSGAYDAQRVGVKGVVTECTPTVDGKTWLMVLSGTSGKARAVVPALPGMSPKIMEDSGILVNGVVFTRCNHRMEIIGISIETNDVADVIINQPGGKDPFTAAMLDVGRLRAYEPKGFSQHRRRIKGVVTLAQPGLLYLQGVTGGNRVTLRNPAVTFGVGDVVEATGFVESFFGVSELTGAEARKLGETQAPMAVDITKVSWSEIGQPSPITGGGNHREAPDIDRYSGMLVQVRGTLLETQRVGEGLEMLVSAAGKPIRGKLRTHDDSLVIPLPGAELSLTGVAEMTYDLSPYWANRSAVSDVRLQLRGPADIRIHHEPPWWTTRRLLVALGVTLAVAMCLGAAAAFLVRRVRAQAQRLAAEEIDRRQLSAANNAMHEERARLAGEMHDGLQPMLSGLAFYLEAADAKLSSSGTTEVGDILGRARALLSQVREEFRQCIWCLYELGRSSGDLEVELRRLVRVQQPWQNLDLQVEITGAAVPLSASITRGLVLACREAVENATRHGQASHVKIACCFAGAEVQMEISDNGKGFDVQSVRNPTSGHFGLSGMRQRIERLDGTLDVSSTPGVGTRIAIRLPHQAHVGNPEIPSGADLHHLGTPRTEL